MTIFFALNYKTSKPVHGDIYIPRSPEPVFLHNTLPRPSSAFTWQQGVIRSDERWDETYIFAISLSPHRLIGAITPCSHVKACGRETHTLKQALNNISRGVAGREVLTRTK